MVDDGVKEAAKTGLFKNRFHFGLAAGRYHRELVVAKLPQKLEDVGGERLSLQHARAEQISLARKLSEQSFHIEWRIDALAEDRQELAIGHANSLLAVGLPVQIQAECLEYLSPALKVNGFAVGQHAVEIKQNRLVKHPLSRSHV